MPRINPTQKEDAKKRYQGGESSESIAAALGFSGVAIRKMLQREGIEIRNPSEAHRTCKLNEQAFDRPWGAEQRYWIGIMLSDGYIIRKEQQSAPKIGLTSKDLPLVESFRTFLGSGHKIQKKRKKSGLYHALNVRSETLAAACASFGIEPKKSATVRPPKELVHCPHFWRGAIDGDGEIDEGNSCPSVELAGSLHTVNSFAEFALKLCPEYEPYIKRTMHRASTHHIDYHGAGAMALLKALYPEGCYAGMQRKVRSARALLKKYERKNFRVLRNRNITHALPYSYKNGDRAVKDFQALCELDMTGIHESRLGYKGSSVAIEGTLAKSRIGYYAAGYYNERLRYQASFKGALSPLEAWNQKKEKIIQEAVSRKHSSLHGSLLANCRPAFSFPPVICRWIIERFGWSSMLDPCMGWGDRLVGFLASSASTYIGCDPHKAAHQIYEGIRTGYGNGQGCMFHCKPFEDLPLDENCVDGAFTSPPYFDAEHYSDDPDQSDMRYPDKDEWFEKFMRPLFASCKKAIRPGGQLVLNIADQKDARYHLCGRVLDIAAEENLRYLGFFEMQTGSFSRSSEPLFVWEA